MLGGTYIILLFKDEWQLFTFFIPVFRGLAAFFGFCHMGISETLHLRLFCWRYIFTPVCQSFIFFGFQQRN